MNSDRYYEPPKRDGYIQAGHVTFAVGNADWLGPPPGFAIDAPKPLRWWRRLFRWVARLFHLNGAERG